MKLRGLAGERRWRVAGSVRAIGAACGFILGIATLCLACQADEDPSVAKPGATRTVGELLADLLSEDDAACKEAVNALGAMGAGARPAVPELVERLAQWNSDEWAREALIALGPHAAEAVPDLRKILRANGLREKIGAAEVLAAIGEAARPAVPDMIALLTDRFEIVRWNAALSLGDLGAVAKEAIPYLIKAIKTDEGKLRWAAICAMEGFGPLAKDAVPLLADALSDDELSFVAEQALSCIGPAAEAAIPALIAAFKGSCGLTGMKALASIGAAAVPPLMKEFETAELGMKSDFAHILGEIGRPAVPSLIKALESADEETRCVAGEALMQVGPEAADAIPALAKAMSDNWAGMYAGRALAAIGDKGALVLLDLLNSDDDRVRVRATEGLADVKHLSAEGMKAVLSVFREGPKFARPHAAEVLGNAGCEEVIPELVAALDDDVMDRAAKKALLKIGPAAVPELLNTVESGPQFRRIRVIWLLARSGWKDPRIEPALEACLKNDDARIRAAAEGALQEIYRRE